MLKYSFSLSLSKSSSSSLSFFTWWWWWWSSHPPTVSHICGLDILQSRQLCLVHQESRMHELHYVLNQSCHHLYKCVEGVKYFLFLIQHLAKSLQWALLHCYSRRAGQWSREERSASRPCDNISPHCDCVFKDECETWLGEADCCAIFLCYLVCEMWWSTQKLKISKMTRCTTR